MSLRRLGINPDGTRHTEDDGPAYARRAGFGGAAIGHFQGIVLTHAQRRAKGSATEAERLGHRRLAAVLRTPKPEGEPE